MRTGNILLMGAAFFSGFAINNLLKKQNNAAALKRFINEALIKGLTGIHNARLAIQQSKSTNLKIFAQKIADDYSMFNQRLMEIARVKNITTYDIAQCQQAASTELIVYSNEKSFDQEYLDKSIDFNKQMINFLKSYGQLNSSTLGDLIATILQQLERHFAMAQELTETLHTNSIPTSSPSIPTDSQHTTKVIEPDSKLDQHREKQKREDIL